MSPAVLLVLLAARAAEPAAVAAGDSGLVLVVPPEAATVAPDRATNAAGDAESGWIGAVVAEMLPRALRRAGAPAVPDADRRKVQELFGAAASRTTRATSIRVAEALSASRVVVGSFELREGELKLALRLLDVERGSLSAPIVGKGTLAGLEALLHSLAWDIALAGSRAPVGTREALVRACSSVPIEAERALGEALAGRDSAARAAGARRALALAPSFEDAALVLARLLVDGSAFAEARSVLARLPAQSVFAREAEFLDGVAMLGLGRYREADARFADLVRARVAAAALSNRAVARMRLGQGPRGASTLLRQAVEVEPAAVDLPFNLGLALLVEGDAQAAAFWLKGVVRRDPGDAQARLLLSWALAAASRPAEAEEQWKAASALTPAFKAMRNADLSRKLERVFVSEHGLIVDPERREDAAESRARSVRGEALLEARSLDAAISELSRAALLDPYAAAPHRLLARARVAQGDLQKAAEELRMALFCREDPVLRRQLDELLRRGLL